MKQVTFEMNEDFHFIQGVAVMLCMDEEGEKVIEVDPQGEPDDYTSVGLLTYALDRQRRVMQQEDEDEEDEE